jgi:hypothetical protein
MLQDVPVEFFGQADLLFIDSTHVSKIGSDVNYEILEIIPTLKPGALVHWHDIVIPSNYWEEWVRQGNQFWNESYMVHAFMLFNNEFETLWGARYMQLTFPEQMGKTFPYLIDEHRIMSFWIRRVAGPVN